MNTLEWRAVLSISVAAALTAPSTLAGQSLALTEALDAAFATHPSIDLSTARESSVAQGAESARATQWPSVAMEVGVNRFQEPMLTSPIHAFDPTLFPEFDQTLVQGRVGLQYTLIDWGGRASTVSSYDAELSAVGSASRASRADLIQRVSEAYMRVVATRAVDAAAGARIRALESEVDRTTQGLEAGVNAEVEVLRASTALQDALAARTTTIGLQRLAERALARLMGVAENAISTAQLGDVRISNIESELASGSSNPIVEQATHRAEAAAARVSAQRSGRYPRLDITGGLMDYGTLTSRHVFEWQAGVKLSWSIFAGGAQPARTRRAEADLLAARSELALRVLDAEAMTDAARTSTESVDARVAAYSASVTQWQELVRIEALALQAGAGVQRELLEAEAGLFQARAHLAEARTEAALARVRLAAALGVLDREWMMEFAGGVQ